MPSSELEHIADFTGPQLSFEFAVPQFAEDVVSGHITTTGAPWNQPRYENPAADISEPNHRAALAERYDAIGHRRRYGPSLPASRKPSRTTTHRKTRD